ncbi:adhesion G protein-coupled receptor E2-like [Bolinopsis microptera]|uniref:adhesion G protein-coupled receptor E2-like n=1 Tax=Bolinopsis microptera TaxID=2820187 RepID=UPI003078BB93
MDRAQNVYHVRYAPNRGSTACYSCDNGHVDDDKRTCTPCPPGKKANIDGGTCDECGAGNYFNETDAECRDCESYMYSLAGFSKCYFCQAGYEVTGDQIGCSACPPGHYNDKPQDSRCKPCEGDELTTNLHGQTQCNVTIVKGKFCPKDDQFSTPAVGVISFPSVQAGQESRGQCFHNNDSAAVRLCNVEGQWERPDLSACESKQSGEIKKIDVETKAGIEKLNEQTMKTEDVAPKDIETVVKKMTDEKVDTVFSSDTGDKIEELATNSMTVVSNMMAASKASPTEQKLKNNIVNCFERIAMLSLEHMKIGENSVTFATDTTDVYLVQNAADTNTTIGDSMIHINVNQGSNIKNLAALIYKDNSAFKPPPNPTRGTSSIAGKVVGLKHTKRDVDTLDNSISFKMKYDVQDLNSPKRKSRQKVLKRCKYYVPENNTWSDTGCTTKVTEDGSVECECDHMTSFAVILSVEENKSPMWLSNLVLGINITFCLLTLLCTLPFRTFRVRKMTIIQSHSILSLLLLCVTWFIMQDLKLSKEKPAYENMKCKVLAFIAQYFLMANFSWIFCCSLTLKSQIVDAVKSFGKKNKNLVKKCVLFGYGFPLLIPSLAILMDFLMKRIHLMYTISENWSAGMKMYGSTRSSSSLFMCSSS